MYDAEGNIVESKLRILSRTYPQAVAGDLHSYSFDTNTALFNMSYTPLKSIAGLNRPALSTVIYYNREVHYVGRGVMVTVTYPSSSATQVITEDTAGESALSVRCDGENNVLIVQNADFSSDGDVVVTVARCAEKRCTC